MSVDFLKKYLCDNPDEIIKVLQLTDFHSVSFSSYNKREIRCAYYEGGNPTSVAINCDTLQCYVFSRGIGGDLFYIISTKNNWSLSQTINFILSILDIKDVKDFKLPFIFGGIQKKIRLPSPKTKKIIPLKTLNKYVNHPNARFLKDNISLETQFKFNIMYDIETERIVVPWFNKKGELVGITGRYNYDNVGNFPKWKALEGFSKGSFLYGIFENFKDIEKEDYVIIGESEKFVMQLDSYGYHNALALGNCNITDRQARIIKSLPVNKIILALDEGVSAEHILSQCEKLKGGIFNNSKEIWCVFDNSNKVLPKGSKASPSDFGKENFETLLNECCYRKE